MKRWDKADIPVATLHAEKAMTVADPVVGEIRHGRKIVTIDKKTQLKVVALFLSKLKTIKVNGLDLVQNSTPEIIIINPGISLDDIKKITQDNTLQSYSDFVKNFYNHNIEEYLDEVFGEKVTCINEVPFSISGSPQRPNVVTYDFLF